MGNIALTQWLVDSDLDPLQSIKELGWSPETLRAQNTSSLDFRTNKAQRVFRLTEKIAWAPETSRVPKLSISVIRPKKGLEQPRSSFGPLKQKAQSTENSKKPLR
eukprot:TRINITY_DN6994_c2_g2_i1.p1 TRINITY_DN6994_c2_g2~~TRINITY_DN6994_c2_g2_i1.p1  ORF type:complete len:105 (+),score=5.74 TRINITY_DN6994_c2_g2_i1:153-467(+)